MFRLLKKINLLYHYYFTSPEKYARYLGVKIGDHCIIETRNWSSEPYLISIGNHCAITNCVSIHTHGGGRVVRQQYPDFDIFGKVEIKDWVYIGAYSQIMPGVTIGEGALIAAGSIVTKSVAPHTVVAGNPAHYICSTQEFYEKNKKYNIGTKRCSSEEKKKILLSMPEDLFIRK